MEERKEVLGEEETKYLDNKSAIYRIYFWIGETIDTIRQFIDEDEWEHAKGQALAAILKLHDLIQLLKEIEDLEQSGILK